MTTMLVAERTIAGAVIVMSIYFMWHATALPIGWVEGQGPGGGAFPFWLSVLMALAAGAIMARSFTGLISQTHERFFDGLMLRPVLLVIVSLTITVALIPIVGAYIAIPLFLVWYLRIYGRHSLRLTAILAISTPLFLFFFFEVTLKILLPKGVTEPLFFPLYAIFF